MMEIYDARYCEDMGDGHILKWMTQPHEIESYAALTSNVFKADAQAPDNAFIAQHSREICASDHPLGDTPHGAIVVAPDDTVVAGAVLQRMPMDYAGIRLHVGRPEIIATAESARRRGYVRALLKLLHAKSSARGDHLQGITGIPYFYQQFGYRYAIDYDGYATVAFADVGPPAPLHAITLQRATPDDYADFVAWYDADRLQRGLLATTPIDASYFRYIMGTSQSTHNWRIYLALHEQQRIGYVIIGRANWDQQLVVHGCAFTRGYGWAHTLPALMQALAHIRGDVVIRDPQIHEITGVRFILDSQHPLFTQLTYGVTHTREPEYAWYVRVADVAYLLNTIKPVLERRMRHSALAGYSGQSTWSFYGEGVTLHWDAGTLTKVAQARVPRNGEGCDATFPPHLINMLIFGRKSVQEMKEWHHEVWATPTCKQLLDTLFPKAPSWFHWLN